MSKPIVSILMPVFNAAKYLKDSIISIYQQDFKDFELIAIDDASEDNSLELLKKLSGEYKNFIIIKNNKTKGISGALNTGLEISQGKYIARADSDDLYRNSRLKRQVEFLENRPDIILLGGGYAPFNDKGHRIDIIHPESSIEIAWKFIDNNYFCHPSVMFRKEMIDKVGTYPVIQAEDYAYFSKVVQNFRTWNLQEILVDYREHQTNTSIIQAQEFIKTVNKYSRDNFKSLLNNNSDKDYEILLRFIRENNVYKTDVYRLWVLINDFFNQIRKIYKYKIFDKEYLTFRGKITKKYLSLIFKKGFKR